MSDNLPNRPISSTDKYLAAILAELQKLNTAAEPPAGTVDMKEPAKPAPKKAAPKKATPSNKPVKRKKA